MKRQFRTIGLLAVASALSAGIATVSAHHSTTMFDQTKTMTINGEVMELRPHFEWRGLGFISHSALQVRERYAQFDAERIFSVPGVRVADPKACQCGEVLKGVLKPWECKVFGTACTPETPIGTCMVSSEGACAAYYNYGRQGLIPAPRQG